MNYLNDKVAAVFAANGAISSAVASAFANHGATVYLSGRKQEELEKLANNIRQQGGEAYTAVVDAMDEQQIDKHLSQIVATHAKLNIVFNGVGVRPSQSAYGTLTTQISMEQFMKPIEIHVGSQFLTSRIAARYMIQTQTPGTILTLTASLSRLKLPFMSGISTACSAIEGLTRVMAAEFGQAGIKVICLNATAMPETRTIHETMLANAETLKMPIEEYQKMTAIGNLINRPLTTTDLGETAAFLASDAGAVFNSHVLDIDFGSGSVI